MSIQSPRSNAATIDALEVDLLITSVMAAVRATDQDRRSAPVLVRNALGVLGVAVAVAAIGGLVALNGSRPGVGSPPSSDAAFHEAGLSFKYPSGWTLSSAEALTGSGLGTAFFVGSVPATATCVPVPSSGGALYCAGFVTSLQPNTLVVRILVDDSTPWMQHYIVGTAKALVLGGLPALMGPSTPYLHIGADRITTWILPSLQDLNRHYVITVAMRGPDLSGLQTQVDALLASISSDPPLATP
jgi:hypothetical protein